MYDINPNKYIAQKARHALSEKVKKSIFYLANECLQKLNLSGHPIKPALMDLKKIEWLFPDIHYLHHALQAAMRFQNISDVKKLLFRLTDSIYFNGAYNPNFSISTIATSTWENFCVNEAIRLVKEDCDQIAEIGPLSKDDLNQATTWIHQSLDIIAKHDPEMVDEIMEQVRIIKVFRGKITMGFTDVRMLGAMFIRVPRAHLDPILYFFEHIIHEASHIHLNCLMAIDPLILNPPEERYNSPLRSDLRPMFGVFHATYVSARIARSFIKLYMATGNKALLHPLAEILDETVRGMLEIEKHAKLTANGSILITSIQELLNWARNMREWKYYNFTEARPHRFGVGKARVMALQQTIA